MILYWTPVNHSQALSPAVPSNHVHTCLRVSVCVSARTFFWLYTVCEMRSSWQGWAEWSGRPLLRALSLQWLGSFFTSKDGAGGLHWKRPALPNPTLFTWHVYGPAGGVTESGTSHSLTSRHPYYGISASACTLHQARTHMLMGTHRIHTTAPRADRHSVDRHTGLWFASSISASCRGDGEVSLSDWAESPRGLPQPSPLACVTGPAHAASPLSPLLYPHHPSCCLPLAWYK